MTKVKGRIKSLSRLAWFVVIWLVLFCTITAISKAAQGGDPQCSLSVNPEGRIVDSLSNLHPITGPFRYYLATLNGPLGGPQQANYFKPPGITWSILFLNEGPGVYHAGLLDIVDNQKGPAKEEPLSTSCSLTT